LPTASHPYFIKELVYPSNDPSILAVVYHQLQQSHNSNNQKPKSHIRVALFRNNNDEAKLKYIREIEFMEGCIPDKFKLTTLRVPDEAERYKS
jgi:hypothetical protein